ncbi:hypothetical protein BBJ29_008916 [Phytophthora kernoviae]|uniref:Uncharacterized protein n=1 Tax=Phytophthora kernoviae TaxID=325452 RepID=A0A3F2RRT6_9STRA|nr:hypothetical protein BBJ29_008916 [Phytophthora kernoviae]RLN62936.1 hypothetical protein BBP00_00004431 [Phytophthora kernoviae]
MPRRPRDLHGNASNIHAIAEYMCNSELVAVAAAAHVGIDIDNIVDAASKTPLQVGIVKVSRAHQGDSHAHRKTRSCSAASCFAILQLQAVCSSCVVPVSPVAALKRARSNDTDLRLLKVSKQANTSSPHSPRAAVAAVMAQQQQHMQQAKAAEDALSPLVLACANIRYAITFIQNSRRHALALCLQNQWERALAVLEKIERANDKISRQRRSKVREQANANSDRVFDAQAMPLHPPQVLSPVKASNKPKRSVRFSDEVQVAEVEMIDRSPASMPMLMRDEILVLRASRPIPLRNFSEFWSSSS